MANRLYPSARTAFGRGQLNWESGDFYVGLVESSYVFDESHVYVEDLGSNLVASAALEERVVLDDGVFDADDAVVTTPDPGVLVTAVVIYENTGDPEDSRLIVFIDENDDTTPVDHVTDGGSLQIIWSAQPSRVFKL